MHSSTACLVDKLLAMTPHLTPHSRSHIIRSLALSTMYYVALSTMYYVALSTMYILASSHRNSHGFGSGKVQQQHGLCPAGTSCLTYVSMTHAGPAEKVEAVD